MFRLQRQATSRVSFLQNPVGRVYRNQRRLSSEVCAISHSAHVGISKDIIFLYSGTIAILSSSLRYFVNSEFTFTGSIRQLVE